MSTKRKINFLGILFLIVIAIIVIAKTIAYHSLRKTGEKVEGTVYSGHRYITWKYRVFGRIYDLRIAKSEYPFVIDGEKYFVYYNPGNPSSSLMSFTEPIIEPSEFDTVLSLPLTAKYKKGSSVVRFKYIIKGDTLNREHRYWFDDSFECSTQRFKVYVKSDNPNISYIEFYK